MSETTSATGATGEIRPVIVDRITAADIAATTFHADDGGGDNLCGAPFSFNDVIALTGPPTCPACLAMKRSKLRLVQSRQVAKGRVALRVAIEGVAMPTLRDLTVKRGATMSGALKPQRVYLVHLGIGWILKLRGTLDGVLVELADVGKQGGAQCPDQAWRWSCAKIGVDAAWWPAVVACEWGEEAPEVAA